MGNSFCPVDGLAACGQIQPMTTVSIRDAKNRLTALARQVERGETIVVTRNGQPIFDLVPHRPLHLSLERTDQ